MKLLIRPGTSTEIKKLAELAAAWNRDPSQFCLHADETAAAVEACWVDWAQPFGERVLVAEKSAEIVGLLSFDVGQEAKRAWLFGPFARPSMWEDVSEALLRTFERQQGGQLTRVSNFVDIRAERSIVLHQKLGYERRQALVHVMSHAAERAKTVLADWVDPSKPASVSDRSAIEALHASAFPATHTEVTTMYDRGAAGDSLRVLRLGDQFAGYVYTDVNAALKEATLQYVAIAPEFRGRGFGRILALASMCFAFEDRGLERQILTVFGDNPTAIRLYERLGFSSESVGVPLDKYFKI